MMMMDSTKNLMTSDRTWRIYVGNINTFPCEDTIANGAKLGSLHKLIANDTTDIVLISEHNKNITKLTNSQDPSVIMKKWWNRAAIRISYLRSSTTSKTEPGGTMIITTARATAHTISAEDDVMMLGRWNSITLRGRGPKLTTIISVYRPQEHQSTSHRQLIASIKRRKDNKYAANPVELWFQDLADFVNGKKQQGHSIIIGGDFNDDLNDQSSRVSSFMRQLGLREIMIDNYGKGPATFLRGTKTIDGIFATNDINIVKGQYVSFHNSPGDHRWIAIDIDSNVLINGRRNDFSPPILRRATSKIPSVCREFQTLADSKVARNRLQSKMAILYAKVLKERKMSKKDIQLYELIEKQMQRIIKFSDTRCRKIRRGGVPFSPQLRIKLGQIIILKQIKRQWELKGHPNRPRTRTIERLKRKYKYKGPDSFKTLREISQSLREARKEYLNFKPVAREARYNYLTRIANEFAMEDGKGLKFHFKRLLRDEKTKEHFRILRGKEGKAGRSGVDRIIIDTENGEEIIYDKHAMEEEIMRVNKLKLQQSDDTILRSHALQQLLGEQGDFEKWEKILKRQIQIPEDAGEELKTWYKMITSYEKRLTEFTWTTEEYLGSWKRMDENKKTTPGIQIAHIKSLNPSSPTAEIISRLALIPIMSGYAPKSWRIGVDSMIPKKTADLRPERLRLILLMDARFNHNNKLIGKKMMEIGEKYNLLADEQYGSRKSKSAVQHALNKRLCFDIIRQQQLNAVYVANDAKSCYDRILLMVAYLTMRNFGIPEAVAKSSIQCILYMKHYVRTQYGISQQYYGGRKWEKLPHGCGQGNGYGPALWACISSPLLHMLRENNFGVHFRSYLSGTEVRLAGIAFVDDTDLFDAKTDYPQQDNTINAQKALDQWNATLRITGGALEPSKTFWCKIGNKQDNSDQMTVQVENLKVQLSRRLPNESFFSLGVWQSPTGKEDMQLQYIINKIETWNNTTTMNNIAKYHARTAIGATIGRTVVYSLPATGFSKGECNKIQSRLNMASLGKMGIVRSVSKVLANSPTKMGGYGIIDIFHEQLIQHTKMLQYHMHQNTVTAQLIRVSMENYILESGKFGCPFQMKYSTYVTGNTWVSAMLMSMQQEGIYMTHDLKLLEKWCEGDQSLMEVLEAKGTTNLHIINNVRIYLRIVTISDLLHANGRSYDKILLSGNRSRNNPAPSSHRYQWPVVEEPSGRDKAIWSLAVYKALDINTNATNNRMGQAISWHSSAVQYSAWTASTTHNMIYERVEGKQWKIWKSRESTRCTRARKYFVHSVTNDVPVDACICSVQIQGDSAMIQSISGCPPYRTPVLESDATTGRVNGWELCPSDQMVFRQIVHGTCSVFTDGSVSEGGSVTYAYILGYQHVSIPLQEIDIDKYEYGYNAVPGSTIDRSSYRGELAGILAAISKINSMCEAKGITTGRCTLYADNRGALIAAFGTRKPSPRWASYDLVSMIRYHLSRSPVKWEWQHVRSHQDDQVPFVALSHAAQGNVIADMLAARAHGMPAQWNDNLLPGEPWRCTIHDTSIGGNIDRQMQEYLMKPRVKQVWIRTFKMDEESANRYNWSIFFRQWELKTRDRRIWWSKFAARVMPTGSNLKRRNHKGDAKCPCCGLEEDSGHLLRCQHMEITKEFQCIRPRIVEQLTGQTDDQLIEGICAIVEAFRRSLLVYNSLWDQRTFQLITEQYRAGIGPFLLGLWHQHWNILHDNYTKQYNQRQKKSVRWVILKAIEILQQSVYKLWSIRNDILHRPVDHGEAVTDSLLENRIKHVLAQRPPAQFMHKADHAYFKRYKTRPKRKWDIERTRRWVEGAEQILEAYKVEESQQTKRLRSFFQWDPG